MATLGDMDHDYTWGHGQVTAFGDMDNGTTWGMDHGHTWGHGLGV